MTYTYEHTYLKPIPLKGEALDACQRYTLGVYRESGYQFLPTGSAGTLPVLFISGSQGNARQIRSLASTVFETQLINALNYTFEFFSLDFLEDISALSSEIVERQTNCVINVIPFIYHLFTNPHVPITIVGHSMGGVIAHYALSNSNVDPSMINTLITLASPLGYPVLPVSAQLLAIYDRIYEFWHNVPMNTRYEHLTFLSIMGGISDHLVWEGLGRTTLPVDRALQLSTPSVNQVWLSCDHLCILWCRQLVLRIVYAFFASVNVVTRLPLELRDERMHVLRSTFLSSPVPLDPPLSGELSQSPTVVNPSCVWYNHAGNFNGVYTASQMIDCTYIKIGPLTGEVGERVLLLPKNVNVKGVYLCNKPINSEQCSSFHEVPNEFIQSIVLPSDQAESHTARNLLVVGFRQSSLSQSAIKVAGSSLIVHLTHRIEGSLLFDLITNVDHRLLHWNGARGKGPIPLNRIQSRSTFYRLSLPFKDFDFDPALPAPHIRVESGSCYTKKDAIGLLILVLPWDNHVQHHRFDPLNPATFEFQTSRELPQNRANLTAPFVDIIIDPRCDNSRVHISYSYAHWMFQILRVHLFRSVPLIAGHILLSIFLLLASCTLHFCDVVPYWKAFNPISHLPLLAWDETIRIKGLSEKKKTIRGLAGTLFIHCLLAFLICQLRSLYLAIGYSSWGTSAGQQHRTDSSLMPTPPPLVHLLYAFFVPLIIQCLPDGYTYLNLLIQIYIRLTKLWKLKPFSARFNINGHSLSFNFTGICIFASLIFHDGIAFVILALAFLLKCIFLLTKAKAKNKSETNEGVRILIDLHIRFVLLFAFCSFLCIEQWVTFAFKIKVFFAGYGLDWRSLLQPSVFQCLLLLRLLVVPFLRHPSSHLASPTEGHYWDRMLPLFLTLTLSGCLASLGGCLHAADSLQSCLLAILPTAFLLNLWMTLAMSSFAFPVTLPSDQGSFAIPLLPSGAI